MKLINNQSNIEIFLYERNGSLYYSYEKYDVKELNNKDSTINWKFFPWDGGKNIEIRLIFDASSGNAVRWRELL